MYIGAEYLSFNYFGTGHGIPTLTDWRCIGNEKKLLDCTYDNSTCFSSVASSYHRAGVRCIGDLVIGI